jgi:hypothetical protein
VLGSAKRVAVRFSKSVSGFFFPTAFLNIGLVLLCIVALVSVVQGYRNAILYSQDFQWTPTVAFAWDENDPYQIYLDNPKENSLKQIPYYLHFTYIMLSPFALLNFGVAKIVWAAMNVAFAAGTFLLLRRRFDDRTLFIVFLLFLSSTPVRNTIGNGQQSLLCLFLYVMAIRAADGGSKIHSSLIAGIAAFKYSFGLPLAFAFDFNSWRNVLLYFVPAGLGVIFWSAYFGIGPIDAALLPLRVLQVATPKGTSDVQSLLIDITGLSRGFSVAFSLALLLAAVIVQKAFFPIEDVLDRFSIYGLLSIVLFYHWNYDHVFLLGSLLIAVRLPLGATKLVTFAIISYFWFGLKAISLVSSWDSVAVSNCLLCVLLGMLLYELRRNKDDNSSDLPEHLPVSIVPELEWEAMARASERPR